MDEIKETAVGDNVGFIIAVFVIVFCCDFFLNFGMFWFGEIFSDGHLNLMRMSQNIRSDVWPQFIREAEYYQNLDLMPADFVIRQYLSMDRMEMGNVGPLMDYFFLKALRLVVFLSYMIGGICIVCFALVEGNKENREKRLNFGRMSSTAYHFIYNFGHVFAFSLILLYLFFPGRLIIPGIVSISLPVTAINLPGVVTMIMTLALSIMAYVMISNSSRNI